MIDEGYTATIGNVRLKVKGNFKDVFPIGLSDELHINKYELFKGSDTLEIEVNKSNKDVKVDIFIDSHKVNLDTLDSQFEKSIPMMYNILFSFKPTYFNIIDKNSNESLKVYAHGIPKK